MRRNPSISWTAKRTACAPTDQVLRLCDDFIDGSAALRATTQSHNAISAVVVTAIADGDHVGDLWRRADIRGQPHTPHVLIIPLVYKSQHTRDIGGLEKRVHERVTRTEGWDIVDETAHDQQRPIFVAILERAQRIQAAQYLILRALANDTCVQ